jgi:hypothetical protein
MSSGSSAAAQNRAENEKMRRIKVIGDGVFRSDCPAPAEIAANMAVDRRFAQGAKMTL